MRWKSMMSKCKHTFRIGFLVLAVCLAGAACRRDMQDQPKMKPYRGTSFFADGLSSRQPVEGTIPRGYLRTDAVLFTGKKEKSAQANAPNAQAAPSPSSGGTNVYADDTDTFPFPITKDTVTRGRERYEIF